MHKLFVECGDPFVHNDEPPGRPPSYEHMFIYSYIGYKSREGFPSRLVGLFGTLALALAFGWCDSILFESSLVLYLDVGYNKFLFLNKLLTEG